MLFILHKLTNKKYLQSNILISVDAKWWVKCAGVRLSAGKLSSLHFPAHQLDVTALSLASLLSHSSKNLLQITNETNKN